MKISWIDDNRLAAGGIPLGIKDLRSLHEQGIRAVLTLTEHPLTVQKEITPEAFSTIGLQSFHVSIVDQFPPEIPSADKAVNIIDRMMDEDKPIFIHCHAGVGRTGTMLFYYYLAKGMPFDEVKTFIRIRKITSGFWMLSDVQKDFLEDLAGSRSG